jgi:hypothetical protein
MSRKSKLGESCRWAYHLQSKDGVVIDSAAIICSIKYLHERLQKIGRFRSFSVIERPWRSKNEGGWDESVNSLMPIGRTEGAGG